MDVQLVSMRRRSKEDVQLFVDVPQKHLLGVEWSTVKGNILHSQSIVSGTIIRLDKYYYHLAHSSKKRKKRGRMICLSVCLCTL